MRFLSLLLLYLCGVCSHVVILDLYNCEVVLVPYLVGAVIVMRMLLDVGMLREYGGDGNAGIGMKEVCLW